MTARTITQDELNTPLLSLDDALAIVRAHIRSTNVESVITSSANGRVLAADVTSSIDVPSFDNAAMDGYAVHGATFTHASAESPIALGDAEHIATGEPVPPTADAVVPWEHTATIDGIVHVIKPVAIGQHIRRSGAEITAGTTALVAGTVLRSQHLGLLSSLGVTRIKVYRRPRVSIAATGNEIVLPGLPLAPNTIYGSNHTLLESIVTAAGGDVVDIQLLPDDATIITEWMTQAAATSDVVITSGGASVGERDWTRKVLTDTGTCHVWRVGIKPGKPFAFGTINDTPVFVLPGNPGAVMTCAQLFAVPALHQLAGRDFDATSTTALLTTSCQGDAKRQVLQPVRLECGFAHPLAGGSSQLLSPFLHADALALLPAGGAGEGDVVDIRVLVV